MLKAKTQMVGGGKMDNLTLLIGTDIATLSPVVVLYVINLAFRQNRKVYGGISSWYELLKKLNEQLEFIDEQILPKYYQRRPKYRPRYLVLFLYLSWLLQIPRTELYEFIVNHPSRWWRGFVPVHARLLKHLSEFLSPQGRNVPETELEVCFGQITLIIFELLQIERLRDEDVLNYACYYALQRPETGQAPEQRGVEVFARFVMGLGLVAAVAASQQEPDETEQKQKKKKRRGLTFLGYSGADLAQVLLENLGAQSINALVKAQGNQADPEIGLIPSRVPLQKFVQGLEPGKISVLVEQTVQQIRRWRKHGQTRVAIDSTILPIYGDYPEAELVYDHSLKSYVTGFKLYLAFDVSHGLPLCYTVKAANQSDAQMLAELFKQVKSLLGPQKLEYLVFDRGFFDTAKFKAIAAEGEAFLVPGKACKTIKNLVFFLEHGPTKPFWEVEGSQGREQRAHILMKDFINYGPDNEIRVIVRRLKSKRSVTDEQGNKRTETVITYHFYLTNIMSGSVEELIKHYGQRVYIENFFEEMKNSWHIKNFPGCAFTAVQNHIGLTLLSYLALWLFCALLERDGQQPFLHRELPTLKLELLERQVGQLFEFQPYPPDILADQAAINQDMAWLAQWRHRRFIPSGRPAKATKIAPLQILQHLA